MIVFYLPQVRGLGMFADVLEEVLETELDTALGYSRHEQRLEEGTCANPKNYHNGHTKKNVITKLGAVEIPVSRNCNGVCEPQIIRKYCCNADAWRKRYCRCILLCRIPLTQNFPQNLAIGRNPLYFFSLCQGRVIFSPVCALGKYLPSP